MYSYFWDRDNVPGISGMGFTYIKDLDYSKYFKNHDSFLT